MAEIYGGIAFGYRRPTLRTLIEAAAAGSRIDTS
jgi:hypothetical protein